MLIPSSTIMSGKIEDKCYSLDTKGDTRGIGLIIVNSFKDDIDFVRNGAESELENLRKLFELMRLEVMENTQLSREEILTLLRSTANLERLESDSMLAVAISSHGCKEGLLGTRFQQYLSYKDLANYTNAKDCISISEIRRIFNGQNCTKLSKKPKFLLLHGCRKGETEEILQCDDTQAAYPQEPIATPWSNFFVAYSCEPESKSKPTSVEGTLILSELLRTYKKYGETFPLEIILPMLNGELMRRGEIHSFTWESSCTRIFLIPPKVFDVPMLYLTQSETETSGSFNLVWAIGSKGSQGPNQMLKPCGLVTSTAGDIYVTDQVSKCIWKYYSDGTPYWKEIGQDHYDQPRISHCGLEYSWGMCIRDDFMFVTCNYALIKISMHESKIVSSILLESCISGLDIDQKGMIHACERYSCKILLLEMDLTILPEKLDLTQKLNPATVRLIDIKVLENKMYILVSNDSYAIQIFSKKGIHLYNHVSSEHLRECYFFTISASNKCVYAGDVSTNELKCFSEEGILLYKTDARGESQGDIRKPMGIDLNGNDEVIVVCAEKTKYILQSFQTCQQV